jgi:hypothetical protein
MSLLPACLPATYNISSLLERYVETQSLRWKCESERAGWWWPTWHALAGQCKFRSEEKKEKMKKKKMNALANLLLDAYKL